MIDTYFIHLSILIGIYFILAISLQLSIGFTGLLNLGHIAFFAIGAYTSALLIKNEFPFWFCILTASLLPSIFAYLLSLATNKLKGDYLALVTLGFSFVVYTVLMNWAGLTRGALGIAGIERPIFFGINFSDNRIYLLLVLIFVLFSYCIIKTISVSNFGKILEATRDNELATKSLGKNTNLAKTISLMISAIFAGLAGSLFAHYISFIDPTTFTFSSLIPILVIVVVGGLGSLEGTIFATIIVILIPEVIRFIGLPSSILGPTRDLIYAVFLLLILRFQPKGFLGKVDLE